MKLSIATRKSLCDNLVLRASDIARHVESFPQKDELLTFFCSSTTSHKYVCDSQCFGRIMHSFWMVSVWQGIFKWDVFGLSIDIFCFHFQRNNIITEVNSDVLVTRVDPGKSKIMHMFLVNYMSDDVKIGLSHSFAQNHWIANVIYVSFSLPLL